MKKIIIAIGSLLVIIIGIFVGNPPPVVDPTEDTIVFVDELLGAIVPAVFVHDDNGVTEFGGGTTTSVIWVAASSSLQLTSGSTTGTFNSVIMDATASATWLTLAWEPFMPYKEFPDGSNAETGYATGTFDGSDIVGLWHLNEASYNGTTDEVIDSSGAGIDMTAQNSATTYALGRFGRSVGLDDSASQFLVGAASNYRGSDTSGAVVAWVYPTSTGGGSIFTSEEDTVDAGRYININIEGGGLLPNLDIFDSGDGSNDLYMSCATGLTQDTWNHVAWVSDDTSHTYYVNGAACTLFGGTSGQWFGDLTAGTNQVTIGAREKAGVITGPFDGYIDEVAVFDREISAQEVLNMYYRGIHRLQFQVRSCNDSACSGESFEGPDGTASTFFVDPTSTFSLPSGSLSNVANNQYFQYQTLFYSSSTASTPQLFTVTSTGEYDDGTGTSSPSAFVDGAIFFD